MNKNVDILRVIFVKYRLGLVLTAVCVPLKLLLFYSLMPPRTHFVLTWLVTSLFTYLLFLSFKNKWIPAILYGALSIMMFADIMYGSFFDRYLTINTMIGSAELLESAAASVKTIFQPVFMLLFADALLIIVMLAFCGFKPRHEEACVARYEKSRTKAWGNKYFFRIQNKGKSLLILVIALGIILFNPFKFSICVTLLNQEVYSFHIKDLLSGHVSADNIAVDVTTNTGEEKDAAENAYPSSIYRDHYAAEKSGPLFGVAEGKNVIVIQVESLQNFVIGMRYNHQEVTPNLNNLINGSAIYFDNFFHQVGAGNTSDAEFAINNSIFGTGRSFTYKLFDKNTFRGLPVLLREQGYATAVFHAFHDRNYWNRESFYKAGGFAQYYGGLSEEGKGGYALTESFGWGLVDSAFFAQSIPYIKSLPEPFYSFMITLSNHHPFQLPNTLRHTINLLPEDDNIVGHYLQSVNYTDFCLGQFIDELKKAGLYENSLIAIYGDHQGLVMEEKIISAMSRLLGRPYDYDILLNVPLIIVLPEETAVQPTVAHTAGGQIDFLPTIAYLLGLEALDVHLGHNLLTIDQGFVATQSYMLKGSFIENDIAFEMSRDGVFAHSRAWNRKTLEEVDLAFCYANYKKALDLIDAADYILDHDLMASNGHP